MSNFGALALAGLAIVLGSVAVVAMRTGRVLVKGTFVTKSERPTLYWSAVIVFFYVSVVLFSTALWLAVRKA